MRLPGFLGRLFRRARGGDRREWNDEIHLRLPGLDIVVRRTSNIPVPHEISVIVPRMEVRMRTDPAGGEEMELTLSSITVAHSPRPEAAAGVKASAR